MYTFGNGPPRISKVMTSDSDVEEFIPNTKITTTGEHIIMANGYVPKTMLISKYRVHSGSPQIYVSQTLIHFFEK